MTFNFKRKNDLNILGQIRKIRSYAKTYKSYGFFQKFLQSKIL